MGRWGSTLYKRGKSLDYFEMEIARFTEREAALAFSPDHIKQNSDWVSNALTVIEVMLLFVQHEIGSNWHIRNDTAVQRWRKTFLSVWDSEWQYKQEFPAKYDDATYRQQHRASVIERFDYLERIAHYNQQVLYHDIEPEPIIIPQDYPLPYYSFKRWMDKSNQEQVMIGNFVYELRTYLEREIIYWLSLEKLGERLGFWSEDVWVAVDILGFLCETYEMSPEVTEQMVNGWRETELTIWTTYEDQEHHTWLEEENPYQSVMDAFDRLAAVAKKYPSMWKFDALL